VNKKILHGVIQILNKRLCDEYILFTKTRNYHWNVVGPNFSERHKFFQEQYEQIDEVIDEIAERARTLNGRSLGTLAEFVEHGSIQVQENIPMNGQ
jgi:starvation-inducible DNA-binding protein